MVAKELGVERVINLYVPIQFKIEGQEFQILNATFYNFLQVNGNFITLGSINIVLRSFVLVLRGTTRNISMGLLVSLTRDEAIDLKL